MFPTVYVCSRVEEQLHWNGGQRKEGERGRKGGQTEEGRSEKRREKEERGGRERRWKGVGKRKRKDGKEGT